MCISVQLCICKFKFQLLILEYNRGIPVEKEASGPGADMWI